MTKKIKKNSLIAVGALLALTLPVSVSLLQARADDTQTVVTPVAIEDATFAMVEGAAARLVANDNYGMKFRATLSASDYQGIMANTAYTDIEFGMLVMPFDYVAKYGDLDKANVFETPVYDWASYNGTDWDYTPSEKTRIINVSSSVMQEAKDGSYYIEGAVKKILSDNIARDFIGRAYIKYTEDSQVKYEMADWYDATQTNNVRSIAFVAQMAIADNGPEACSQSDKDWMQTNYVDAVLTDETSTDYAYIDRSKTVTEHTFTTPANATALRVTTEDYTPVAFTANGSEMVLTETLIANGLTAGVLKKGENIVYVHTVDTTGATPVYKVYKECLVIADKIIMQSDILSNKTDKTTVKASFDIYSSGYIVLGEDINMGDVSYRLFADTNQYLTGTFDGRGHKITAKITSSYGNSLISMNYGTVQNLCIELTGNSKKWVSAALVDKNYGNVNNVYVKFTYSEMPGGAHGGTVVGANQEGGTVNNCIGEVMVSGTISGFQVGTIVANDNNAKNNSVVRHCYGITNGYTSGNQNYGKKVVLSSSAAACDVNTCEVYTDYSGLTGEVTSLPAENGWSKFWSLSNGTLKFGAYTIYAPATM